MIRGTVDFGGDGDQFWAVGDFRIPTDGRVVGTSLNGCRIKVAGDLTLKGISSNLLDLVATADWDIYWGDEDSIDVEYVEVAHSKAQQDTISTSNSIDAGANENWSGLKRSWYRLTPDLWHGMSVTRWDTMLP